MTFLRIPRLIREKQQNLSLQTKTIETGAATGHAVIDVNAAEDAEADTHQDDAAQSVSLGSGFAENNDPSRNEPKKPDVALSDEQINLVMRSFDGKARPVARSLQPQIRAINGQDPKAILQPTNYTFDKIIVETLAVQTLCLRRRKEFCHVGRTRKLLRETIYLRQMPRGFWPVSYLGQLQGFRSAR